MVDVHCVGNAILHHAFPFITSFKEFGFPRGCTVRGPAGSIGMRSLLIRVADDDNNVLLVANTIHPH